MGRHPHDNKMLLCRLPILSCSAHTIGFGSRGYEFARLRGGGGRGGGRNRPGEPNCANNEVLAVRFGSVSRRRIVGQTIKGRKRRASSFTLGTRLVPQSFPCAPLDIKCGSLREATLEENPPLSVWVLLLLRSNPLPLRNYPILSSFVALPFSPNETIGSNDKTGSGWMGVMARPRTETEENNREMAPFELCKGDNRGNVIPTFNINILR